MGKQLQIDVTADDIKHGLAGECALCPIALSLRRAFPSAEFISVADGLIVVDDSTATMTKRIADFVTEFDDYGADAVKPTTFTVFLK